MNAILDAAAGADPASILLVMLPGAGDRPEDFVDNGFVRALRDRALPVDVAVAYAGTDYYLDSSIAERLAADIIAPARRRGYARIWLMGISLGGLGAVAYASEYPSELEGVILLAPFLGMRGIIAEVLHAGGLQDWQSPVQSSGDLEHRLLAWLKRYRPAAADAPEIYLGYGTDDRFAPASAMLAQQLPADRVVRIKGGHNWETWIALWKDMLDRNVFSSRR
jgi:pimeloyl-ACP methyl ester carboxylesterase